MWNRRRGVAISQSEIRKKCKLMGAICRGHRAFREGIARGENPFGGKEEIAWFQGWDRASEQQKGKENG